MKNKANKPKSSIADIMEVTFDKTVELATSNSVMGEPVRENGVTVIPISKISAGFAGGGTEIDKISKKKKQSPAGAGAKVEVTPTHFLQISGGKATVVPVANTSPSKPDTLGLLLKAFSQLKNLKKK